MNTSYHSYPKVYALGHRYLNELLLDIVTVEEKIDGSQFSFGRFDGELKCRTKGVLLNIDFPEKMFADGVSIVKNLDLHDGWTYRAEYLKKPKHNALAYDRIPKNNLIIFDINTAEENYLTPEEKKNECDRIGLEVVPAFYHGLVQQPEQVFEFMETISCLGGQKIEGIVIKNYSRFGIDKKVLMGKYVSEAFKEVHAAEWKDANPNHGDIIQRLITGLRTPARWHKAVQHLRERGEITDSPRDIGNIIKEVHRDIKEECEDEIKQALYNYAIDKIKRGVAGGVAEWYKEELLKLQFATE